MNTDEVIAQYERLIADLRAERDSAIESRDAFRKLEGESYRAAETLRRRLRRVTVLADRWMDENDCLPATDDHLGCTAIVAAEIRVALDQEATS